MTLVAAVATGRDAVADLQRLVSQRAARGDAHWVAHNSTAVTWTARHPWVSSHDDGEVLVVLDGQLHNLFDAESSQAALLHRRYADQGENLGGGLLGDFVVIVLDRPRDRLLVLRDPLGVRPWHQASAGLRHAGATDVATLCGLPWVDDSPNEAVALAYLAGASESRGETFHKGIRTLAPGATWHSSLGRVGIRQHHEWELRPEPELGWEDAAERCREVFDEAVRCRVEVAGAATSDLSGGLDSSAVVGTVAQMGRDDLLAGRMLFEGPDADERSFSDAVIAHWSLRSLSVSPWLPTEEEAVQLTALLQRPAPDPNFTMVRSLHRAYLGEGRSSGLTGLGGDDAFLATSTGSRVVGALQQRQFDVLRSLLRAGLAAPWRGWRTTWRPTLRYLTRRDRPRPPRYLAAQARRAPRLNAQLARPVRALTGVAAIDERARGLTSGHIAGILEEAAVISDQSGWRATHPFLDPRVIAATYGVNPWFALRNGHDRALEIQVFGDRLPPVVRLRRSKADFAEVAWPRRIRPERLDSLLAGPLGERGWLDVEGFTSVFRHAEKGRASAALPFSRAVALDRWFRQGGS